MGFLDQYADHGMDLKPAVVDDWSEEAWVASEQAQAATDLAILTLVARWPRRLGAEATAKELAADKRKARRYAWAMRGILIDWGGDPEEVGVPLEDDELRRTAATLDMDTWCAERLARSRERCKRVATICVKRGQREVGNRMVQRYLNEQKHLTWGDR